MIGFIGDIHGNVGELVSAYYNATAIEGCDVVIQVGDMGWYEDIIPRFKQCEFTKPLFWIDGNHEQLPLLMGLTEVTELLPNFFYVPRGTVLKLDGKKIGFMGGAASVDKEIRMKRNLDWHPEEVITEEQIAKFDGVDQLDILVTHTPPQTVVDVHFDPQDLVKYFGLSLHWYDPSARLVDALWKRLNKPTLICGHMHRSVTYESVRILNINQLYLVP